MELTAEQDSEVKAIMSAMDCQYGFPCYESKFEKFIPVEVYLGANVIRCRHNAQQDCQYSFVFGDGIVFCQCPLRSYVAFELGR